MRIRIAVPDAHVTPAVLDAALEATTLANQSMLESGEAPPVSELIDRGKVKWKPENFKDGEHFDLTSQFKDRGWADCDDLAPAFAAELRATGKDPGAKAITVRSGPSTWHATTQLSSGEIVDPSKAAGMGRMKSLSGSGVMKTLGYGAVLGVKRIGNKWASRLDLPIEGTPSALCGVALCRSPFDAITEAVHGATLVGEASGMCTPEAIAKALAIQAACAGEDYGHALRALSGHIDGDELGSIFSSIAHGLKSLVPMAANFLPIPGAGLAASALTHLIPGTPEHAAHQAAQAAAPPGMNVPPPVVDEWALKIKKGVRVTRAPNGAFMVRF